ncbi:hypothetical protein U1Q18_028682, partial [Sarracenia purpurea var. burkii]
MVNLHFSSTIKFKSTPCRLLRDLATEATTMMIGERNHLPNPTVHVNPWTLIDDSIADTSFPYSVGGVSVHNNDANADDYSPLDALMALHRYLPSNDVDLDSDELGRELDIPMDAFSSDQFRIFEFKVRKCNRGRSHDWTECPYAHPGEKARRRDPRKFHYSGTSCPDFRKGNCKKGDACEFSHGVFECWLHPARYRTQPCKDGTNCRRRVCFFAHSPEQLRVLSPRTSGSVDSYDGSPHRHVALESSCAKSLAFLSSPESVSPPPSDSPPLSPMTNSLGRSLCSNSMNEMIGSLRRVQLNKVNSFPSPFRIQIGSSGYGSPRFSMNRPDFCSLPSTPTGSLTRRGVGSLDLLEKVGIEEEPVMERVESGRDLRAKMFEKLSRENPLDLSDPLPPPSVPDVGWVSEL